VPVEVELRSFYPHPVIVTVEAIDRRSHTHTTLPDGQTVRPPPKGMRWEGKTKYTEVTLSPSSSRLLPFAAAITKPGVFDLKRFKVTVNRAGAKESAAVNKVLYGQCLIELTTAE